MEKYWDYNKNSIDPFNIKPTSKSLIYLKCTKTNYHGTYKTKPTDMTAFGNFIKCPYCGNTRVHKLDSLGTKVPEILEIWSDKNKKTPYDFKVKSKQKVWLKCKQGKHSDTLRTLSNAYTSNYDCPECVRGRDESKIEENVRLYINKELGLETLHEYKCNILPINPKTKHPLPYDNEVIKYKLIIEVHGIQHYHITNFANMAAKTFGTTPEYEFKSLQWRDEYKKKFALLNGYHYLAVSYKEINNGKYKYIINNKIKEISNKAV